MWLIAPDALTMHSDANTTSSQHPKINTLSLTLSLSLPTYKKAYLCCWCFFLYAGEKKTYSINLWVLVNLMRSFRNFPLFAVCVRKNSFSSFPTFLCCCWFFSSPMLLGARCTMLLDPGQSQHYFLFFLYASNNNNNNTTYTIYAYVCLFPFWGENLHSFSPVMCVCVFSR